MAQKGRKVAEFALTKSVAYGYFLDETSKMGRKMATGGRLNRIHGDLRKQCCSRQLSSITRCFKRFLS